jgi:hypothetical protein
MSHSNFKLANNFITSNCYTCVELNAHALVNIICNFRDNPLLTNEMFLPYLFSSQPCEKIFRTTRSMTSTLSTVVNYSIKDIMQRLDRIKAINNILHDLKDVFTFPREVKKRISSTDVNVERSWETTTDFAFNCKAFSNECIRESIENALRDVIKSTQGLAMTVEESSCNILSMSVVMESEMETNVPENVPDDCEMSIDGNIVACTEEADKVFQLASDLRDSEHDQEQSTTSGDEDTLENTTLEFQNDLNFKDFSSRIEKEDGGKTSRKTYKTGLFVTVKVNGKPVVIKKSSLCWLLDDTKGRVSTDRLRRFINNSKEAKTILPSSAQSSKRKSIFKSNCKSRSKKVWKYISDESEDDALDESSVSYADSSDAETSSDCAENQGSENKANHSIVTIECNLECNKFYAVF